MRERFASGVEFMRRAWGLAAPYWRSDERWRARLFLGIVVALTLALVYLQVLYNDWNRSFFEALQNKDFASFGPLLLQFGILASLYTVGAVIRLYLTMLLQMRWRIWMTQHMLDRWLHDHIFYRLELLDQRTDNPDQRIAEDLRLFTFSSLSLALGLLSSVVTLVSFITILWAISGSITLGGIEIPGYMVYVALLYSVAGSVATHLVGRRLIPVNFQQQRVEADLRFGLVRLRENAEGVALYRGQPVERADLNGRIDRIRDNWWQVMRYTKNLTIFTTGYDQLAGVFPLLVSAPRYFSGAITLGVLSQIGNAFGRVEGALSWFVESYGSLASWKATVDRLLTFEDAMRLVSTQAAGPARIEIVTDGAEAIRSAGLNVALPDGRVILPETNLAFAPGERVLITGPTGAGKSTLFRAVAGIWPFGRGKIEVPARARVMFLPQRAYLPIGALRDVVSYPAPGGAFDDNSVRDALSVTGLGALAERLDEVQNWSNRLSGGEQQRLAIARALLHKPDWLFLDEATAALDEGAERDMYALLNARLPGAAIISIAHRPGVAAFHPAQFALVPDEGLRRLTPDELQSSVSRFQ